VLGMRLNNWTAILVFIGALVYFLRVRGPQEWLEVVDGKIIVVPPPGTAAPGAAAVEAAADEASADTPAEEPSPDDGSGADAETTSDPDASSTDGSERAESRPGTT